MGSYRVEGSFYLGQWVEFDHVLRRESIYGKKPGRWRKAWVRAKKETTQGIVIGIRHLTNGENRLTDYGVVYTHLEFITAVQVSTDLRRKHELVLIKDAKELS